MNIYLVQVYTGWVYDGSFDREESGRYGVSKAFSTQENAEKWLDKWGYKDRKGDGHYTNTRRLHAYIDVVETNVD